MEFIIAGAIVFGIIGFFVDGGKGALWGGYSRALWPHHCCYFEGKVIGGGTLFNRPASSLERAQAKVQLLTSRRQLTRPVNVIGL